MVNGSFSSLATMPEGVPGRQESSSVSLEWVGPANAKLGQVADYALVVRNVCAIPVQKVVVQVRLPAGMTVKATDPQVTPDTNNVMVWELGTLMSRQEKILRMKLLCQTKGDLMPQAWVTFTGSSVARIRVREPKLALKVTSAERVLIGENTSVVMTVSNPGDGTTDMVKVHANLSPGLENARGSKLDFEVGNLAAGESRTVQLLCVGKAGGKHMCEVTAEADGGLNAHDACNLQIVSPRLELSMHGPSLKYLDRHAIYTLKITNPGDAPATNVMVADVIPEGFKVLAASDSGRHDSGTRTVSWSLGDIGPGLSKEVKFEVRAVSMGEYKHQARATAARAIHAETSMATRVDGLSALLLELVDTEDPIEVSGDTAYELRVTNTGTKTENDIRLIATLPDKMELKHIKGPLRYKIEGKKIVFDPLETLAPRADVMIRINVKAMEPGNVRFKIQMTSASVPEPVIKMEATRIYSDSVENDKSPMDRPATPMPLPGSINPSSGVSDLPTINPPAVAPRGTGSPQPPVEPMNPGAPIQPASPSPVQPVSPVPATPLKIEGPGPMPVPIPGRN